MTRALVGYATRAGSTADVAAILAESLSTQGFEVTVANLADKPSALGYDLVVIGSGIHGTTWFKEATVWALTNSKQLQASPVAIFNVCLNAADPAKLSETLGYNRVIAAQLSPIAEASFAGRYTPEQVGFFKRLFLRSMGAPAKDYIDPAAIRAWAEQLAATVTL